MAQKFVSSVLFLWFSLTHAVNLHYSKIVGGTQAAPNEFPWIARLTAREPDGLPTSFAGSLISDKCILTGKFVLDGTLVIDVVLGAHNLSDTSEPYQLKLRSTEFYAYPQGFDPPAIVVLPEPVTTSDYVQPIRMGYSEAANDPFVGQMAVAIGWGATSDLNYAESNVLRKVEVPIISNTQCGEVFGNIAGDNLCTSGTGRKGICYGDMGGPLNYYSIDDGLWSQVGINSGAAPIGCQLGFPSVYIRILPDYKPWIESICGPLP